jgi:hypothetical protein
MKDLVLIIIGGNSRLVSSLLELNLEKKYKKIIIISHRKFQGNTKHTIVDELDPKELDKTITKICSSNLFNYNIIISNTPPIESDFTNETTREWSMTTLKIINMISFKENINKVIFVGSCLPLLPIYHNSIYKRLKDIEMRCYFELDYHKFKKNSYIILPPLKSKNYFAKTFFLDTYQKWSLIILKELKSKNSIVYPSGLIGIITKTLFLIRFKIV